MNFRMRYTIIRSTTVPGPFVSDTSERLFTIFTLMYKVRGDDL